jgi:hypothetical protein
MQVISFVSSDGVTNAHYMKIFFIFQFMFLDIAWRYFLQFIPLGIFLTNDIVVGMRNKCPIDQIQFYLLEVHTFQTLHFATTTLNSVHTKTSAPKKVYNKKKPYIFRQSLSPCASCWLFLRKHLVDLTLHNNRVSSSSNQN